MPEIMELSVVAFASFIGMCMLSTLYGKANPLYNFAEETYIGFGTALSAVWAYNYIMNTGWKGINAGDTVLIAGFILGLITLIRVFPKYAYIARIPLALSMGNGLGLSLRTSIFTGLIDQVKVTMYTLFIGTQTQQLYRWTIAITLLCMLTFFIYTIELKGPLKYTAMAGEYFMYIAFGAIFAQTFMGRLSLFVGYVQNYITPSWKAPYFLGIGVIVLVIVIIMDKTGINEKYTPED